MEKPKQGTRSLKWKLSDIPKPAFDTPRVFSIFSCCGGSTMGYKLAGCNVIGCLEMDQEMMSIYKFNHKPAIAYCNDDILDGSPPCSVFSMAGNRQEGWGIEKAFHEGGKLQRLDDLFFHFIDTVNHLRPKMVIAENVKGLIFGNAKGYVREILVRFSIAGYAVQIFLLNSARMGVPQKRERVFFVARRKDLGLPPLILNFQGKPLNVGESVTERKGNGKPLSDAFYRHWRNTVTGRSFSWSHPKGSYFNACRLHQGRPSPTLISSSGAKLCHWSQPREMSTDEMMAIQTFPDDFNFLGVDPKYVMGMSVPPFMMCSLVGEIRRQWPITPKIADNQV